MKTAYYTVDGEIVGEATNGVRLDYLTDALGSVTAKVDQAASVVSSTRYKPYGEKLSGSDFVFGWVGAYGYRTTASGSYIRARHYTSIIASWASVDKYWPNQPPYVYANQNPTSNTDSSGNDVDIKRIPTEKDTYSSCGHFRVNWKYLIEPKEQAGDGWLVQHVKISEEVVNCLGVRLPIGCPPKDEYYEAWKVVGGEVLHIAGVANWLNFNGYHDTFAAKAQSCTAGFIREVGDLKFFKLREGEDHEKWLSDNSFVYASVGCARLLPATIDFSNWAKGVGTSKQGVAAISWFCCFPSEPCSKPDDDCFACPWPGDCAPSAPIYSP